jgi:hypothetical protein
MKMKIESKKEIIFFGKKVALDNVKNRNLVRILSKPRMTLSYSCGDGGYSDR